ncbi:MAG: hypothetical protein ACRDTA_11510 [Pseudonocardiaceae bacterium]
MTSWVPSEAIRKSHSGVRGITRLRSIHDTLARLAPDSPHRPSWIHQLGILAQFWGDPEQAERCYQQSLQILERLGDQVGMASGWSWLGDLAGERQQFADATVWYIRALLMRIHLQIPEVAYNVHALVALRVRIGSGDFVAAARTVVDETQLAEI